MNTLGLIAAAVAVAGSAATADAATFNFDYSILTAEGADPILAKGVIEATDLGGFYSVDNVTGKRGDEEITGYDFFDDAPQSFNYDNGTASNVDFLYRIGDDTYEVRFPGNGSMFGSEFMNANTSALVTSFNLSPAAAVPEPASWAMLVGGIGIAGFAMRRRQRARVAYA